MDVVFLVLAAVLLLVSLVRKSRQEPGETNAQVIGPEEAGR